MGKSENKYSASDLLNDLKENDLLEDGKQQEIQAYLETEQDKRGLPAYLHIIATIGAVMAAVLFLSFMESADLITHNDPGGLVLRGIIFAAMAIVIQLAAEPRYEIRHALITMTSLTMMFMGKVFMLISVVHGIQDNPAIEISTVAFVISAATYSIYRNPIDRFFSILLALGAAYVSFFVDKYAHGSEELLFNGFIVIQLVALGLCIYARSFTRQMEPLFYALTLSISGGVIFLSVYGQLMPWDERSLSVFYPGLILAAALILMIGWISSEHEEQLSEPLRCAMVGAFLLGVIAAPGVTLSIGLMVLGYKRAENLLLIIGGVLLAFFIVNFYYSMEITLLEKSGILAGSGLLLLIAGWFIKAQGWTRGAET